MRLIFIICLIMAKLALSPALAATIIDFSDVPPEDQESLVMVSNGYVFSYDDTDNPGLFPSIIDDAYVMFAAAQNHTSFSFAEAGGLAFGLQSLDTYGEAWENYFDFSATVTGYKNDGNTVNASLGSFYPHDDVLTYSFDSTWDDLNSVEIEVYNWSGSLGAGMFFDNIVVSTVPIPAAVWLFGSALAGLGWMRRKQTV